MGLLGKLFGDDKAEKKAADFLKNLASEVKKAAQEGAKEIGEKAEALKTEEKKEETKPYQGFVIPSSDPKPEVDAPFGVSWGEEMPAEENQFNYNGPFTAYFEHIFAEDFPQYRVEKQAAAYYAGFQYTFWEGEKKALVVELLPQSSAAQKLRRDCRKQGTPYLRYYYNHDGWWNTRRYVVNRTRAALKA